MRIFFLFWSFLFLPIISFASTLTYIPVLEELIVTASRLEIKGEELVTPIDIIKKEEIRDNEECSLSELLAKYISAANIISYPGLGGINLRGFSPSLFKIRRIIILIDGHRYIGENLWTFPLEEIERIEIYKTGASSLWGAEAMGGVINIITKPPEERLKTIQIGIGKFKERYLKGELHFGKTIHNKISLGYKKRASYEVPGYGLWENNEFEKHYLSYSTIWRFRDNHEFDTKLYFIEFPNIMTAGDIWGCYGVSSRTSNQKAANIKYKWRKKATGVDASIFIGEDESTYFPQPNQEDKYENRYLEAKILQSIKRKFLIGFEYKHWDEKNRNKKDKEETSSYFPDSGHDNFASFLETFIKKDRLTLHLSTRYDSFYLFTKDTPSFLGAYKSGREHFSNISYNANLNLKMNRYLTLSTSYNKAFSAPTPKEKVGYYSFYYPEFSYLFICSGNPQLAPEKSNSLNLGAKFDSKYISFSGDYFITDWQDKIDFIKKTYSKDSIWVEEKKPYNIGEANIEGFDINLNFRLPLKEGKIILPYLEMTYLIAAKEKYSKDLYNVAKYRMNYGLRYISQNLSANLHVYQVGRIKEINWFGGFGIYPEKETINRGDFKVVDLHINGEILKNLALRVSLYNLFDEKYEEKFGYPQPGFSATTMIEFKF